MLVRFVRKNAPYNVGDLAGFPEEQARALLRAGKVVVVRADREETEPEPAAAPSGPPAVKHVGGGWYAVGGERIRGKERAEAYAASLASSD